MRIIASGTFDHLHDGHKMFLNTAFEHGHVMIGLTSQSMLEEKRYHCRLEGYERRRRSLVTWLASCGRMEKRDYEIIMIDKPHGFACEIRDIDAILVTEENESVASSINSERAARGFKPLKVEHCDLLKDKEGKISSTRKRAISS
ncbi:MAG: pantetheine-phosphate adenylyltransferase [Candidatus Methanofastidiosa archaeon]|nr:pantetheine-phosphate adenylyltransferase [Candidatus Methanofastidiosa archaeon]